MAMPHMHPCHAGNTDCTSGLPTGDDASVPSSNFECSICLELSQDPVVTMCGHLFCWSCLHQWISVHSTMQECPVCKACVKDKIVPLYGRGKMGSFTDSSRSKPVPKFDMPRPSPPAQRSYERSYVAAAASVPSYTPGFQHHSFAFQENYVGRGAESTYSASSFGLFPALFGVYMVSSPDYGSRVFSGAAYGASLRLPAIGHATSEQHCVYALQECVLYWFLILLACFAVSCFLLF